MPALALVETAAEMQADNADEDGDDRVRLNHQRLRKKARTCASDMIRRRTAGDDKMTDAMKESCKSS